MGINKILHVIITILFMKLIIQTFIFIKQLLKVSRYNTIPQPKPRNKYPLIIPLLNVKIEYNIIIPVNSQKNTSSIDVKIIPVLKLLRVILNKSNNIPITNPLIAKIRNNIA